MTDVVVRSKFRGTVRRILYDKVLLAFLLVILLFVAGEVIVPGFSYFSHIMTVLQASFFLGLVSLGQTIVVISGKEGLDLSVGSTLTVGVLIGAAVLLGKDANLPLAILAVIAAGFILGLVNGFGISYLGLAPLIMTLAWGIVIEGVLLFISRGSYPGKASPLLEVIGHGSMKFMIGSYLVKIPWVIVLWLVIIGMVRFVLRRTSIGYVLYGIGANPRAAELLGIRTKNVRVLAYGMSSMLSALSGMFMLGFVANPNIALGERYVLPSVVAVIIGGIDFGGGSGSYLGAVAGSIFLTTLASILTTLNIGEGGKQVVTGMVLIVLLIAYTRKMKR